MRLSELIGSEVRDGNDRVLGQVVDVRVEAGPPAESGDERRFVVTGVLVGRLPDVKSPRPDQRGPFLFASLDRRRAKRRRFVPWTQVRSARPGSLTVRRSQR